MTLVKGLTAKQITLAIKTVKHLIYIGMPDRAIFTIGKQILLAYIGGVIAIGIFGQQMIERLVFFWPRFGGNRIIPFIGIIEFGININNDAAKRIQLCRTIAPMLNFAFLPFMVGKSLL